MAELTPQERLQPALLDRLTDEAPATSQESREARAMSVSQLREAVIRDLAWLLNASRRPDGDDIYEFPLASKSVLNFGMPDMTGRTASSITPEQLEAQVAQTILNYEPRLLKRSLQVRAVDSRDAGGHNVLALEIRSDLWARPLPETLFVQTEVDLETGRCELRQRSRTGGGGG